MFGFGKRKEAGAAEVVPQTVAEEMGLREYVSVDSLKAHLVDMMEENRRHSLRGEDSFVSQDEDAEGRLGPSLTHSIMNKNVLFQAVP